MANQRFLASGMQRVMIDQFEIALERGKTLVTVDETEDIAWIAFSQGSSSSFNYVVGRGMSSNNIGRPGVALDINLTEGNFIERPDVIISQNSRRDVDGSWARGGSIWNNTNVQVHADEDITADKGARHSRAELFSWATFGTDTDFIGFRNSSGQSALPSLMPSLSPNPSALPSSEPSSSPSSQPSSTPSDMPSGGSAPSDAPLSFGETGRVTLTNTINEGVVSALITRNEYVDPVIVCFVATRVQRRGVSCRIRNVDPTTRSFDLFMQEPRNLRHRPETINYIVFESGSHILTNGLIVEAGKTATNTVNPKRNENADIFIGDIVSFNVAFERTPVVLHSLNTYNNNQRFLASGMQRVMIDQFEIALERGKTLVTVDETEDIAWIAFSQGSSSSFNYVVGRGMSSNNIGRPGVAFDINLTEGNFIERPDVIISQNSRRDVDGSWARGGSIWNNTNVQVHADEDITADKGARHSRAELFSWATFGTDTDFIGFRNSSGQSALPSLMPSLSPNPSALPSSEPSSSPSSQPSSTPSDMPSGGSAPSDAPLSFGETGRVTLTN